LWTKLPDHIKKEIGKCASGDEFSECFKKVLNTHFGDENLQNVYFFWLESNLKPEDKILAEIVKKALNNQEFTLEEQKYILKKLG